MKKLIIAVLVVCFLLSSTMTSFAYPDGAGVQVTAGSAILIDAKTGDILYQKNANKPMFPASTTKIMTAILTLENCNMNDKVVIDKETSMVGESRIGLVEGEEFTVQQLLYIMMIESVNAAATALAKHISGSTEKFAQLMNKRAKELGAKNTHFDNPNGLPDPKHYTTAYDLAMIAKYAMTIPKFREIVSTARYQVPPTNKVNETRYLLNSNRFLWGVGSQNKINYGGKLVDIKYGIVDGIKTGYTSAAGQCLVSSAVKGNRRLIAVVLKTQGRNVYSDSRTLLDYGFNNFKPVELIKQGQIVGQAAVKNGVKKSVDLVVQADLIKTVHLSVDIKQIKKDVIINPDVRAPINKGEVLGKIIYSINGREIGQANLVAKEPVNDKLLYRMRRGLTDPKTVTFYKFLGVLVLLLLIFNALNSKRGRR